jgi:hypothetical protein
MAVDPFWFVAVAGGIFTTLLLAYGKLKGSDSIRMATWFYFFVCYARFVGM